jgi:hypothetical protein
MESPRCHEDKAQRCPVLALDAHKSGMPTDLRDLRDRVPGSVGSKPLAQSFHSSRFWFVQCHPQRWFGASLLHHLIVLLRIKAWYKNRKKQDWRVRATNLPEEIVRDDEPVRIQIAKKSTLCGRSNSLSPRKLRFPAQSFWPRSSVCVGY